MLMSSLRNLLFSFLSLFLLVFTQTIDAKPKKYQCGIYRLSNPDAPDGEVAFVNGINHKPARAVKCGVLLADMAGGYNVYVIYNPTDGLFGDLKKCYHELFKFKASIPVKKLQEKWDIFFASAGKYERMLQFCHSQGSIQVRNALMKYPEERRKRIIVVAIAPAAYIGSDLCYKAYHYISRRDIVPLFDRAGFRKCREKICLLTPHPQSAFFDHHFLSPTYKDAIQHHLQAFINSHGRECE